LEWIQTAAQFDFAVMNAVGVAHDDISKGRKYGDIVFHMFDLSQQEQRTNFVQR